MATDVTQKYLQEYFATHDTLILYKPDGTPVTFRKESEYVLRGGGSTSHFKTFEQLKAFFREHGISQTPTMNVS